MSPFVSYTNPVPSAARLPPPPSGKPDPLEPSVASISTTLHVAAFAICPTVSVASATGAGAADTARVVVATDPLDWPCASAYAPAPAPAPATAAAVTAAARVLLLFIRSEERRVG